MAKTLGSKLKTGVKTGIAVGAGLIALAGAPRADATIAPQITTTIYEDVDQDLSKPGFQVKYEWSIYNQSPPATSFTQDAIWNYSISANLESRGMYGFENNASPWSSSENTETQTYTWLADLAESAPIRLNEINTFSALIDKNLILGNQEVSSTAGANTSQYSSNVIVPIPEPTTIAILGVGAATLLAGRRLLDRYKYR